MKVLVIVPSYKPAYVYGGPIRSIASLCESLQRAGIEIEVWTTNANGTEELLIDLEILHHIDGVKVRYFNRWTKDHSNFSPALLLRLVKEVKKFDIVHIQSWWNMTAVPSAMICRARGIRPIISPRGSLTAYTLDHGLSKSKQFLHHLIGKKLLNASLLHLTSAREKTEAEFFSLESIKMVIPNIPEPCDQIRTERSDNVFQVLFLGRIDPAKNIEVLLKIFSQPLPFEARLVIAGTGKRAYVDALKQSGESVSAINWVGQIDGLKKHKLISSSDLLVLPSLTENFGNVVLEALTQGTPVMVSEGVGIKDFVKESNLGVVIKGGAEEWREAMIEFYDNASLRQSIRRTAAEKVMKVFGEKILVDKYLKMYREATVPPVNDQEIVKA